jgi:hypothetical protein
MVRLIPGNSPRSSVGRNAAYIWRCQRQCSSAGDGSSGSTFERQSTGTLASHGKEEECRGSAMSGRHEPKHEDPEHDAWRRPIAVYSAEEEEVRVEAVEGRCS